MAHSQTSPRSQCPACCHEALRTMRLHEAPTAHPEENSHCPWVDEILTIFVASSGAERVQTSRMLSQLAPCQQPAETGYSAPVEGTPVGRRTPIGKRHLRLLS